MSDKKTKNMAKRIPVLLIAAVLVVGVVAGAGIWLMNVNVPVEYDDPYTIEMSQSEIGDYNWKTLQFKETSTTETAYFNETGSGISYHQYVKIENPTNGANVNVIADIEEPNGFNDQMGFTVLNGIVEPGEAGKVEVDSWGNISTGDIAVAAGETKNITVIYTLSNEVPSSNSYSVNWDFSEGEAITVNSGESIQNAIDSATGTVIFVEPGTYNENLTIDVPGLVLTSTQGPEKTVIDAQGVHIGVEIKSNLGDITVEGFTVKNWSWGGIGQGISGREGTSVHVKNNIVQVQEGGHDGHGNSIQVTGNGSSVIGNEVEVTGYNSEKDDSPSGILNWGSSHTTIRDNNIYYVDEGITDKYAGIGVGGGSYGYTPPAEDVVIKRNTIFNTTKGLEIGQNTRRMTVEDNTFNENRVQVLDVTEQMDLNEVISLNNFNPAATVVDNKIVDDPGTNTALNLDTDYRNSSIQDVIDDKNTTEGDTILVGPGTYQGFTVDKTGLEILATEPRQSFVSDEIVKITADNVVLDGFVVEDLPTFTTSQNAAGILVTSNGTTVRNNIVRNLKGNSTVNGVWMAANGIHVFSGSSEITDITIEDNLVENITSVGSKIGSAGIKVQGNVNNTIVQKNEVKDISSEGWSWGITITSSGDTTEKPENITVKKNEMKELSAQALYGIGFGIAEGVDPTTITYTDNNMFNSTIDYGIENKNSTTSLALDATDNYWGVTTASEIEGNIYGYGDSDHGPVSYDPWLDSAVSDAGTSW